jgi:hypothetical protein
MGYLRTIQKVTYDLSREFKETPKVCLGYEIPKVYLKGYIELN